MDAQKSWSLTNPGGDNTTLRFQVNQGDVWQQGDAGITPMKNRSEIAGTTQYALGTNIHIGYNWTVEAGPANTASWLTSGQLRQAANDSFSAPFAIMMNGEHMRISVEEGGTDASWSNFHDLYYDPNPIVRGHQYHMQIDARFDAVNGHLDVIRDGVTLVNYDGPLGWANMGSVYWKEGVYRADAPESMAMDYGNLSITTGTQTSTPTAPPPSAPTALSDAAIVGGYVNATNDTASQLLNGAAAAGATVTVYDGAAKLGVATANSSGQWSYTLGHLADGAHSLTATATTSAGVSGASAALAFTVDTQAPGAPSGLSDSAIVSGVVDAAHDTASQAVTGTAAAGAAVTVYDGLAKLGVVTANSSGQWSYTLGQLADGSHSLTATATDVAGNVSSASSALQFTVNTQAATTTAPLVTGVVISGTTANDTLTGLAAGHDTINGLDGNDILYSAGPANSLNGGAGSDMLFGRGAGDVVTGGSGTDYFVFDTAIHNVTVTDFDPMQDIILLQHNVFTGMATGKLAASALYTGTAAQNTSEHIIYNPTTGDLMYDPDGSGSAAAQTFAHLQPGLTLYSWDFTVY